MKEFSAFSDKFRRVTSRILSIPNLATEKFEKVLGSTFTAFKNFDLLWREFEKNGFTEDFWVLSTSTQINKMAIHQVGAQFAPQIKPVVPIPVENITPIIPANRTAKLMLVMKKNTKLLSIQHRFTTLKQQEFDTKLELELATIPTGESPLLIQEFKTYFSNTQKSWTQFLEYQEQKQLEETQQRKLEQHRIQLQGKQAKQQMKHQLREFEETGGYEAIQDDEIERVRKKALPVKKTVKKASLSPEIADKIQQRKLKNQIQADSEDRAQKFFKEKQKLQQDYLEKLKKMQNKRKQ